MQHPAWNLVLIGLLIAVVGFAWLFAPSVPWLGRLPGDIRIEKENFQFYFPITTCIALSVLFTGIMWVIHHFSRR